MKAETNKLSSTPNDKGAGEMSEAEIDDNLEDTFPASGPPAWTLGSDHRSPTSQDREDDAE